MCKLSMVIEVFRHGAREPIYHFWNADSFSFPGELTSVGIRQHYLLGKELRKEYIDQQDFLSKSYNPNEIYIRSSDYNRTIMSALSQMQGLYPLGTGAQIPEDIDPQRTLPPYRPLDIDEDLHIKSNFSIPGGIQPIPVHTVPEGQDRVLLGEHSDPGICPLNKKLFNDQKSSEIYRDLYKEFENNTISLLKNKLNISRDIDLGDVAGINDVFVNDLFANKPLPDFSPEVFKNITFIFTMNLFYTYNGGALQRKIIPTPIINEILSNFQEKVENKTLKKLVLFSGHDTSLGYLYTALNISNYECHMELRKNNKTDFANCEPYPSYATNLLIELHEEDEKGKEGFFVKVKVNGKEMNMCEGKEKRCDWKEFQRRLQNNLAYDYDDLCKKIEEIDEIAEFKNFLTK